MQELLSNLWSLEKGHPVMEPVEVVGEFGGLKVGNHPKKWLYDCLPLVPFSNTFLILFEYFSTIIYMHLFSSDCEWITTSMDCSFAAAVEAIRLI